MNESVIQGMPALLFPGQQVQWTLTFRASSIVRQRDSFSGNYTELDTLVLLMCRAREQ